MYLSRSSSFCSTACKAKTEGTSFIHCNNLNLFVLRNIFEGKAAELLIFINKRYNIGWPPHRKTVGPITWIVTHRAGSVQLKGLSELARRYQKFDRPIFKRLISPFVVCKANQLAIQKMLKSLQQTDM